MLSHEDNERLVRVGPGTPAGALFRRYWQPAVLCSELPGPDCAPVRVRLLGEDLLAWRDSTGRAALTGAFCPHRRAPLFYGRNEECGLRCVYHGWKFDADGTCTDLPTEAPGSPMRRHVRIEAYPTVERGGIVWAYLGPPELAPSPPDYEFTRAPAAHLHVTKTFQASNYLQALEGGLDTAHSSYLHNNRLGDQSYLRNRDGAPKIDLHKTDYGYLYTSDRNAGADGRYFRVYHYVMPAIQLRGNLTSRTGGPAKVPKIDGHVWVPVDDETCCIYNFAYTDDASNFFSDQYRHEFDEDYGRAPEDFIEGTFWLKRNQQNDYLIDREVQRTRTYTGIKGINTQDMALQEGMGPIVDRSKEILGSTDRPIVTMRRMLLDATRAVERGETPPGLDPATHRNVRPYDGMIAHDSNWRDEVGDKIQAKW